MMGKHFGKSSVSGGLGINNETRANIEMQMKSTKLISPANSQTESNQITRGLRTVSWYSKFSQILGESFSNYFAVHFIHRKIITYLDNKNTTFTGFTDNDLKIMAMKESSSSIVKARSGVEPTPAFIANGTRQFLKAVLLVFVYSTNLAVYQKLQALPIETQQVVATLIEEIAPGLVPSPPVEGYSSADEQSSQGEIDSSSDRGQRNGNPFASRERKLDRLYEVEEQFAIIKAQLERKESECQDLKSERDEIGDNFSRLQESYVSVFVLSVH